MLERFKEKSARHLVPMVIIIATALIGFHQVAFMEHTMKWDIMDQFFPVKYFFSECIDAGFIPFWNPYINLGYPFYADPQSGFYYPLTWFFSLTTGYHVFIMNIEFILHVIIAGLGMYQLLNGFGIHKNIALLFSIVFLCSGMFVSNATHLTWVISIAWMPFVIHHYLKLIDQFQWKHAIKFGFFLSLCLMGGYPIFTVILCYLLMVYFLYHLIWKIKNKDWPSLRKLILYNAIGFLVFLLLASGYIFSFIQASEYIARGQALTVEVANSIPFTPKALLSLVFPFGLTADKGFFESNATMTNIYMGLITLPLLLTFFFVRKDYKTKVLFIFGVICLLASFGSFLPVRSWLFHTLPLMDMFRHAAIFRTFTILCFIIIAAYSLDQLMKTDKHWKVLHVGLFGLFAIVFISGLAAIVKNGMLALPHDLRINSLASFNEQYGIAHHIALQAVIQILVLAAMICVIWKKKLTGGSGLNWLTAIIVIEMIVAVQLNAASTIVSEEKPKILQSKIDQFPKGFPLPDDQPISSITSIGDGSLNPIWYNTSIFKKQIAKDGFNNFYLSAYEELMLSKDKKEAFLHPFIFTENSDAISELNVTHFRPTQVNIAVLNTAPIVLSMVQNDYPGWKVMLNGKEIPHFKTNHTFISANIPKGSHQVAFVFNPEWKFFVIWMPLISIMVTGLIFIAPFYFRFKIN